MVFNIIMKNIWLSSAYHQIGHVENEPAKNKVICNGH